MNKKKGAFSLEYVAILIVVSLVLIAAFIFFMSKTTIFTQNTLSVTEKDVGGSPREIKTPCKYNIAIFLENEDGTFVQNRALSENGIVSVNGKFFSNPFTAYKEDYEINGYSAYQAKIKNTGKDVTATGFTVTSNEVLNVQLFYKAKEYKIVYMDADGDDLQYSFGESNPVSYYIYTNDITLKTPIKKGYTFIGWTGSNGETPDKDVTIPKGSTGDRTYTANWKLSLLPYYRFYTTQWQEKYASGTGKSYRCTWNEIQCGGTCNCNWVEPAGCYWDCYDIVTTYSEVWIDSSTPTHGGTIVATKNSEWSEWSRCDGEDLESCPTNSGNITYESKMCNPDTESNEFFWGINSTYELHLSNSELTGTWMYKGSTKGVFTSDGHSSWYILCASKIKSIYIDNTIIPTSTAYWFYGLSSVTSIDGLNKIDTSNVTNMSYMFNGCSALTSLDVSNFDTSNVTDMSYMFSGCSVLTSLDLSSFNTSNVIDTNNMFSNCPVLTTIKASNSFNTDNVTSSGNMFYGCSKLVGGNGTKYSASYLDKTRAVIDTESTKGYFTDKNGLFWGINSTYELHLSNSELTGTWKYKGSTNGVFASYKNNPWRTYASSITSVYIDNNITPKSMAYWFYGLSSVTSIEGLDNLNTSNVTNMSYMFNGCSALTSLDVSNFDTSNVTTMKNMFYGCLALESLNIKNFKTINITDMEGLFRGCAKLASIDVGNFNTSNVTSMKNMFYGCSVLVSLDLSNFNTYNVTNMSGMFYNCSVLTTIKASNNFNTNKTTSSSNMFYKCSKLVGGNGTKYSASYLDKTRAVIDTESTKGYFTQY